MWYVLGCKSFGVKSPYLVESDHRRQLVTYRMRQICLIILRCDSQFRRVFEALELLQMEFEERFHDYHQHATAFRLFQNPFEIDNDIATVDLFEIDNDNATIDLRMNLLSSKRMMDWKIRSSHMTLIRIRLDTRGILHWAWWLYLLEHNYVCQHALSWMKLVKSRLPSRIYDEHLHQPLRLSVSNMQPDIT